VLDNEVPLRSAIGLAIDNVNAKTYWSQNNSEDSQNTVYRSNLDGSSIETVISTVRYAGNDIAVDSDNGELYFIDSTNDYIKKFLDVDSIGYLSEEGLLSAVSGPKDNYCIACFSGDYPTKIVDEMDKRKLERDWQVNGGKK